MKKLTTYNIQHTTVSRGFTIIEVLVSTAVFAVSAMSIIGIYASVQRINQKSAAIQTVAQSGRFILEDLTKLIANGTVDYNRYPFGFVPWFYANYFYMIDRDGTQMRIYQSGSTMRVDKGVPLIATSDFHSSDVVLTNFRVYIYPVQNPFPVTAFSWKEQPTVTVFFTLRSNLGVREQVEQSFQTTVATRQYPD